MGNPNLYSNSSTRSSSVYTSYTLAEIDNIITKFHEYFPQDEGIYQTNLNNKLLYIIRDLLIRIQKLEKDMKVEEDKKETA